MTYSAQQTKMGSLKESLTNLWVGMVLNIGITQLGSALAPFIQTYIYSNFIWDISFKANIIMTVVFTFISTIRSYTIRRIFTKHGLGYSTGALKKTGSKKRSKKRSPSK